ncbi:hypothetical protein Tco_0139577 [Tanacetum coccineum]
METKDTLSSYSNSEEQEMQQMQKKAKILKECSMNKFNALQATTEHLSNHDFPMNFGFKRAFYRLFGEDERTFKFELTQNMKNLETQLNKETLHEQESKSAFRILNAQFHKFIHSEMLKTSNYEHDARQARDALHEQDIQKGLQRLNDKKLQIQECKVLELKATDASSGNKVSNGFVSYKGNVHCLENDYSKTGNDQSSKNQGSTSGTDSSRSRNKCSKRRNSRDDTYIRASYEADPIAEVANTTEYNVFVNETQHSEQPENMNNKSLMGKVDSNTTLDSSDTCNNEFEDD